MFNRLVPTLILVIYAFLPFTAQAIFIDGEGHYALKPTTQTNPGFSKSRGLYQATLQSFGLLGDIKAGDKLNLKMMLRVFDNPETAYLGDTPRPSECSKLEDDPSDEDEEEQRNQNDNYGSSSNCDGRHQDTNEPGYKAYKPKFTEVYVEYGFDYCLLEIGRRSRDWGMGIFLDSGRKPFSRSSSIYDGISCKANPLGYETFGFTVGYDRLAETGAEIDVGLPRNDGPNFGPTKTNDDLDQMFFSLELDDRKVAKTGAFARHIGIYFANIFGGSRVGEEKKKVKSDVKYADLYTAFYVGGFSLRNELLFRLGKTTDPNWSRYGGISTDSTEDAVKNNVNSIGFAGELGYRFAEKGSYAGPQEYNQGNAAYYEIFSQYGYAPGDRSGYLEENVRRERRSKNVSAIAFNKNFKPAQILFAGNYETNDLRVDGAFDPGRVMNAYYGSLGLRYASLQLGTFEGKFVTGQMVVSMPQEVRDQVYKDEKDKLAAEEEPQERPIGYSGTHLGYELDLSYSMAYGKNVNLGGAAAVAIPGPAWRTRHDESPEISYLLQGTVGFKF